MENKPVRTLYEWRIEQGMNQTELAQKSGADRSVISAIEKGLKWYLSPKKMLGVCQALGVHYTQIAEFAERAAERGNADDLKALNLQVAHVLPTNKTGATTPALAVL